MAKKLVDVVVKRKRWFRGHGSDKSLLRQPVGGRMCCLGFACMASGVRAKQISGVAMPYELDVDAGLPSWCHQVSVPALDELAQVNDDQSISDTVRERAIRLRGPRLGLRFSFVD